MAAPGRDAIPHGYPDDDGGFLSGITGKIDFLSAQMTKVCG
jgi:hypothetical protein